MIHDSIRTSPTLQELSFFENMAFLFLLTAVDDFGRYEARLSILKGTLFSTRLDVTEDMIGEALDSMSKVGLVRVYRHGERDFLELPNWLNFQKCRAKKSKYPDPPWHGGHEGAPPRKAQGQINGGSEAKPHSKPVGCQEESGPQTKTVYCQNVVDLYHQLCPSLKQCLSLTDKRKGLIIECGKWLDASGNPGFTFAKLFEKAERSPFLKGKKGFVADLEFLLSTEKALKVLEGNYDDDAPEGEKPAGKGAAGDNPFAEYENAYD
jgi:hypothetical protein